MLFFKAHSSWRMAEREHKEILTKELAGVF